MTAGQLQPAILERPLRRRGFGRKRGELWPSYDAGVFPRIGAWEVSYEVRPRHAISRKGVSRFPAVLPVMTGWGASVWSNSCTREQGCEYVPGEAIPELLFGVSADAILTHAVAAYRAALGERLVPAYALGSLAHGGFSPLVSDIDLGLITRDPLEAGDAETIQTVADVERPVRRAPLQSPHTETRPG